MQPGLDRRHRTLETLGESLTTRAAVIGEENDLPLFLVKWQVCLNPLLVSFIDNGYLGELALALRIFRLQQVTPTGMAA